MNLRILIIVICASCSAFPPLVWDVGRNLHAAISIDNFTAATNDRFANDAAFVGADYDLSGVARTADGPWTRWATLVAPNIILTADHYPADTNQDVFFYRDNDPTVAPVVRTVLGGQKLLTSDLRIAYLDRPVPISIADYPILQTNLTTVNFETTLRDEFAIQLGNSPTTSGYGADTRTNMAMGHNRLEVFTPDVTEEGVTGDVLSLIHNQDGDAGFDYEHYEAELFSRDSGSPVFTVDGGELHVAGIAWAKGDVEIDLDPRPGPGHENLVTRVSSVYTYTGNLASQINAYIDSHVVMRLPGDYNVNGIVDAADFAIWRDNLGSTTLLDADGNGNGVIDEGDYDIWRTNLATLPTSLGSTPPVTSAVPEPTILWFLLSSGLCLIPLRQLLLRRVESGP